MLGDCSNDRSSHIWSGIRIGKFCAVWVFFQFLITSYFFCHVQWCWKVLNRDFYIGGSVIEHSFATWVRFSIQQLCCIESMILVLLPWINVKWIDVSGFVVTEPATQHRLATRNGQKHENYGPRRGKEILEIWSAFLINAFCRYTYIASFNQYVAG